MFVGGAYVIWGGACVILGGTRQTEASDLVTVDPGCGANCDCGAGAEHFEHITGFAVTTSSEGGCATQGKI